MKKTLFLASFALAGWAAHAQPVINSADFDPTAVAQYDFKYGVVNQIDPGAAGTNVNWDFSSLTLSTDYPVSSYICPGAAECSSFATANQYLKTTVGDVFYNRTATEELEVGVISGSGSTMSTTTYTTPYKSIQFPITYNQAYSSSYSATVASGGTTYTQPGTLNSVIDGYGTLTTPVGTYTNVLRQKLTDEWSQTSGGATVTITTTTYNWYKAGVNQPILTIIVTTVDLGPGIPHPNPTYTATYLATAPNAINGPLNLEEAVHIYPNPVAHDGSIMLTVKGCSVSGVRMSNLLGQEIMHWNNDAQNATQNIKLPIPTSHLAAGIYLLTINAKEGSLTKKIIAR
ncbi:MAG TPA: T9SS type A sorting domain-containing protein [Edaphocola sp.]|nr:T9SS type A sorting domain-containing protein [Edaphocola sp.]